MACKTFIVHTGCSDQECIDIANGVVVDLDKGHEMQVIMRTPDQTKVFRLTIDNNGNLVTTELIPT